MTIAKTREDVDNLLDYAATADIAGDPLVQDLAASLAAARGHSIWYPLFDTPITLTLSREQLQCVQEALLGRPETVAGWNEHFAGELEKVLRASIDGSSQPTD